MRTRDKTYADYGLDKATVKVLIQLCRDMRWYSLLSEAAQEVYPTIAVELTNSLHLGWSWGTLDSRKYVPIDINSFYGYRRKVLWLFGEKLKAENGGVLPVFEH
ncbi:MAG: hypothetical protein HFE30_07175 [Clostridiales bacterium]|nr:hypothetical protein [Clostridiales bacterium]